MSHSNHLWEQRELEEGGNPATSPQAWEAPSAWAPSPPTSASGPAAELLTAYLITGSEALGPNGEWFPSSRREPRHFPPHPKPAFASSPSTLSRPLHS